MLEFNRPNQISPSLLLLDGISGTGKTMVSRLLDSLEGTTAPFFDYTFEQLLIMRKFEKISTKTRDRRRPICFIEPGDEP